jgi:hypothetical protein
VCARAKPAALRHGQRAFEGARGSVVWRCRY